MYHLFIMEVEKHGPQEQIEVAGGECLGPVAGLAEQPAQC